jgi:ATP-dependent helicase/nuclease subunit B
MYQNYAGRAVLPQILEESIFLENAEHGRFGQNPELAHLEKELFRNSTEPVENHGNVEVLRFDTPRAEVEYVTDYIAYLIRTEHLRYRDFAIITGDMESYGKILADNLAIRGIPYFMDNKRSLILNPAVSFLRAALEMVDKDFSYESVFQFLKSGISVLDEDDVDILENYAVALGIRGYRRYEQPFTAKKRKMTEEELEKVNAIREQFFSSVTDIYEELKGKRLKDGETLNVRKMTEYIYQFLVKFQLKEYLEAMEEEFANKGEMSLSKEYEQTYRYIIELFDKLVSLLGEEEISLKEYREIIDAGFEEIKVGVIPLGMDQVMVGDIERSRLNNIRTLFVIGANDGVIPKHSRKSSLLSQSDRNYLKKINIELSPTVRESIFIQKFYLYLNLTKPSGSLLLSYTDSGIDGKALRPSYLIGEIERLYDRTDRKEDNAQFFYYLKLSSGQFALKYLSERLNRNKLPDMNDFEKELYSYFYSHAEYADVLKKVREGVFFDNNPTRLSSKVAEQLNGDSMVRSVSRLEKYAACAYAHFLSYSLRLAQREQYEVSVADMGTIYHRCIELFSSEMTKKGYDFRTMKETDRNRLVEECVAKVTENYGNTILRSSKRNEYLIRKISEVCKKTVWAMCEHIRRGKFTPENFEFTFSDGRIDRLDTYEKDGKRYLKIIDYKSGNKKFELSDVFNGLQMQLVYYMGEALKLEKSKNAGCEVLPAGTFYFHIKSPYVECSEKIEDEQLKQMLLKEYKMSGLVNDMKEPAVAMDEVLEEEKAESDIIPLKSKELGQQAASSGLNEENFGKILGKVDRMIDHFTDEILDGNIEKNPYKKANMTPCTYCSYKSICGFDERAFHNQYRKLVKVSKTEDVLRELEEGEQKE